MYFKHLTIAAFAAGASAFPAVASEARALSSDTETNAGFFPNKGFNAADQFVDVRPGSGHEFKAPRKTDVRGPCPGLNAAANHGFTSRTGVNNYHDTTEGLFQGLGIGKDFTNILFFFSMFNSGSFLDLAWSIGGPMKTNTVGGLLGQGLGLSNSHNKYEGDASTGRGDAYLHGGDSHSLVLGNYKDILKHTKANGDNFSMKMMRKHLAYSHEFTRTQNPYGFFGPGNFFVSPIAHEFVTAMMSNHSAQNIGGTLPKHILHSFFAVKEHKDGSLEWIKGHDRIPMNWYRRPSSNPYGVAAAIGDLALSIKENPAIADIGGNLGTPGDYAGIQIEDLSGGAFNLASLSDPQKLQCFALQAFIVAVPGIARGLADKATPFFKKAAKALGPATAGCPALTSKDLNMKRFNKYPGYSYSQPLQPATPY